MSELQSLTPRISVAPMMDWTTRDYRFFARLFNPNIILYTEMVTTGAIIYGGANRHLDYNHEEHQLFYSSVVQIRKILQLVARWRKTGVMTKSI